MSASIYFGAKIYQVVVQNDRKIPMKELAQRAYDQHPNVTALLQIYQAICDNEPWYEFYLTSELDQEVDPSSLEVENGQTVYVILKRFVTYAVDEERGALHVTPGTSVLGLADLVSRKIGIGITSKEYYAEQRNDTDRVNRRLKADKWESTLLATFDHIEFTKKSR